jgi:hypothetical protein
MAQSSEYVEFLPHNHPSKGFTRKSPCGASRMQETVDLMAKRDLHRCRWFLRTAKRGVLAAGGGLDHESCERSRKTRKSARWQGFFSCVSWAFVSFVFQTLSLTPQMSLPFSVVVPPHSEAWRGRSGGETYTGPAGQCLSLLHSTFTG